MGLFNNRKRYNEAYDLYPNDKAERYKNVCVILELFQMILLGVAALLHEAIYQWAPIAFLSVTALILIVGEAAVTFKKWHIAEDENHSIAMLLPLIKDHAEDKDRIKDYRFAYALFGEKCSPRKFYMFDVAEMKQESLELLKQSWKRIFFSSVKGSMCLIVLPVILCFTSGTIGILAGVNVILLSVLLQDAFRSRHEYCRKYTKKAHYIVDEAYTAHKIICLNDEINVGDIERIVICRPDEDETKACGAVKVIITTRKETFVYWIGSNEIEETKKLRRGFVDFIREIQKITNTKNIPLQLQV